MRDGWVETTLGEVAEWFSGGTPKAGKPEFYDNGTIPWVIISDMLNKEIYETTTQITTSALKEIGGRLAPINSVLISMYATVGRPAIARIPVATNQAIAWSVPNTEMVLPDFLLIVAESLEHEISSMARGATQRNINRAMLREFKFLLPPLVEQRRIVDVVESVDNYIAALQDRVDAARIVRNAVLHELLNAGGDGWVETTLGELCDLYQPQTISQSQMSDDGEYLVYGANGPVGRYSKFNHEESEVAVSCRGTCGTVNMTPPRCWITGNAMVVRPNPLLCSKQLMFYALQTTIDVKSTISGSAQPQITRLGLAPTKVSIPPLVEQRRIVDVVSSMDDSIQATEQTIVEAKNLRSGLLSDLLSGEHEIPAVYDKLLGAA
jgi:restriction endonuclease S subunit